MKKICECCKSEFNARLNKIKYCSKKCANCKKMVSKVERVCVLDKCNNTFIVYPKSKQLLCSRQCQILWQKVNMKGEKNPNYGNRKPNMFKHTDKAKKIIKEKVFESWKKKERLEKHLKFFDRHRLDDGSMDWQTKEFREKISSSNIERFLSGNHSNSTNFKSGYYINIFNNEEYYQSSWELIRMKELDLDKEVKFWTKKHNIIIDYYINDVKRKYIPDFYIEYKNGNVIIEEIKGYIADIEILKQKIIAAKTYCENRNIKYIINYYNNKNSKKLIEWEQELK